MAYSVLPSQEATCFSSEGAAAILPTQSRAETPTAANLKIIEPKVTIPFYYATFEILLFKIKRSLTF